MTREEKEAQTGLIEQNIENRLSNWETFLNLKSYANQYRNDLNEFLKFMGKDIRTVLRERDADLKSPDDMTKYRYEDLTKEFYAKNCETDAPNTAWRKTSAVRSFFKKTRMRLELPNSELEEIKKPETVIKDYDLDLRDVKDMIKVATPRAKAIILTMQATGLRSGDLVNLKRAHVLKEIARQYDDPEKRAEYKGTVDLKEMTTGKRKISANSFLHADAVEAIKAYLKTAKQESEWLFFNGKGTKMNNTAVNQLVQRVFEKAGIDTGGRRFRAHCLRKFCQGRLEDAKINSNMVKQIIGKQLGKSQRPYSSSHLREAYISAQPYLLISKVTVSESYAELKREMQRQKEDYERRIGVVLAQNRMIMNLLERKFPDAVKDMKIAFAES